MTTANVSGITQTSAVSGGNVTNDGGAEVTSRGVCWSTIQNSTTSSSKTVDGTGSGTFTSKISGLVANANYYIRAYATNSEGTSYGNEVTFATNPILLATLTTAEVGTAVVSIPRNTGVWAAWDDFVTSQYIKTWIGGISKAVYQANFDNPHFKGVIYFGLHFWSLGYEEVTDPTFVIDTYQKWVPWGTQRGVRLSKICELPYVDHIICEAYPPIHANLYKFISTYKQIIGDHNKTFGLMLHRDDHGGLDKDDLESDRWAAIQYFQPAIIARIPIDLLFPSYMYYDKDKEALFDQRLHDYRGE